MNPIKILFALMVFEFNSSIIFAQNLDLEYAKSSIKSIASAHSYTVNQKAKRVPIAILHIVNKEFKKNYNQEPLFFSSILPWKHTTRRMQFYLKSGRTYLIVYRHGGVGVHEHLLFVDSENKFVMLFYYNGIINSWQELVKRLENEPVSSNKLLTLSEQEG